MNIGIDIRSLLEEKRSGVGEYAFRLLDAIFSIDKENNYFLFYNSFKDADKFIPEEWKKIANIHLAGFHYPNKLFNFSLRFFNWPKVDKLLMEKAGKNENLDLFFLPNINFIALSPGIKKVITVHDLSFERFPYFFSLKRRLWHFFINPKKLIKNCDKIIAISENTKKDLMDLYNAEEKKIKVIYSGAIQEAEIAKNHFEKEELRKKYNLPDKFILFVGTIEPRKNIEGLVRAFEILKSEKGEMVKNYHLVVVGPYGWLYKKILERAEKSPYGREIRFINYVSEKDKFYFYQLAKVFVYISFYEGFGFPPLEAAASGTPVIISSVSAIPEVIGNAAVMVDPNNPKEAAEAIYQCLTDNNLRERMREKGKKQVAEFTWEKCAREVVGLFGYFS
ncbi:hypothetical protein A2316_01015 [Candidatus Falkowbacteria bacterium RIFOXYB2_FULL_38_15]|uniref:Glycosyl transferase family 1 domain-containing protein n=1 Tax=Candidatus Falkowbacteria bacterium RIFOXYA2_FULL_38_12 TaxID=1797993 RepID=A0A1F5S5U0_9BACT|nr:MAG: hypothetical protein A2257_02420 [Candidatus Falkowbacteria bacterium RIFOXYA2_FULL_38_12]OGF32771.1 MAG: hypothetical protein A2316_01015 [Candidatus Falkowbacteria bacterium RIFOXYB2_FULL_38_15]OGF42193.1 MAG: hypothetical protein A2555_02880 [Candidatus Falkowbacteria bacterium RIFOXYD2_FULL_39_16]